MRIEAAYEAYEGPGSGTALVLAHGFSGSLERPALRAAARSLTAHGAVVTFSFRGHGGSGGRSTVGNLEVLDLAAVVRWARALGHRRVATIGFSMGGSVALRHAALHRMSPVTADGADGAGGAGKAGSVAGAGPRGAHPDAVVSVSAAARWYYRGTAPMRRLHWAIQRPAGRMVSRWGLGTRVHPEDWDPVPLSPVDAAPLIAPVPLLVVHGDQDPYFPLDHPRSLAEAADPACTQLWTEPGFGHAGIAGGAETAAPPGLLHRIGAWAARTAADTAADTAPPDDGDM
ncbi:alpha/beta hydrolase [Streptomyces sp. N2-109]|uniref:Alpha/beta hydrolase n=1 Tax=Streptomyces gossypii TaxID=2883101 RepID=A0ABT2JY50_9ACTN|nr:alpha/beta hydrolase [Streptomyces gossypii]MCT2592827.1 alpha/beta hydrolase [Streptomyces gossypii]